MLISMYMNLGRKRETGGLFLNQEVLLQQSPLIRSYVQAMIYRAA